MIITHATEEVTLTNVGNIGEFRIRNSSKAFHILSNSLYSNKIKAIVRELGCNALDSHVAAGKEAIPFEVHLPTMLEPWFAVRDFGLGLDGDQIVNIYTTYFESTKTDSNSFIGALGLGSKSPFSYTDNFTVTAIKNGIKRIYSAFINAAGVPSIAEMTEELSDEGNGVEVKFSVTDRYDYTSFRNEASNVFKWFKHKPNIIGDTEFSHTTLKYKEENIVTGVHVSADLERGCIAVMGNIAYPLTNMPETEKHFGRLSSLLNCGLILDFKIGELDFAASREQLSYIPLTIDNIRNKLTQLNDHLATHLADKANAITGEWERADFLYNEHRTQLYSAAVKKYVADTNFPLFDPAAYQGKKIFKLLEPDLEKKGIKITGFYISGGPGHKLRTNSVFVNGKHTRTVSIPVDKNVIIVLNDLNTGCASRAMYHFGNKHAYRHSSIFCLNHSDPDLSVRQKAYDSLIKELHNPPTVVKASELDIKERTKPLSNSGIATIGMKSNKRSGYEDSYTWIPYTGVPDENTTYYYVTLNNHEAIDDTGATINVFNTKALMDESGVSNISTITIFGVRKNRIKEIKKLKNWVWFEDKLKMEVSKISDDHISSLVAAEIFDQYNTRVYTNSTVAAAVGPNSDYAKYVRYVASIKRATGNVSQLSKLCQTYGKTIHADTVRNNIIKIKDVLHKKYPILKYFKDSSRDESRVQDLIDYIKLVDNS